MTLDVAVSRRPAFRCVRSAAGFTSRAGQTVRNALLLLFGSGLRLVRQYRRHAADALSLSEIQERVARRTNRALACTLVTNSENRSRGRERRPNGSSIQIFTGDDGVTAFDATF